MGVYMPNYNKSLEVSCPNCGVVRLARGDLVRKAQREGKDFWCLPCRNRTRVHKPRKYTGTVEERRKQATKAWRDGNKDKVLNKRYKERYGITLDEYNQMLINQDKKCLICGVDENNARDKKLVVDHNHSTGAIRGLLCHSCNCGLGYFKDKEELLNKAINYLRG
jgi:predicted RNA-binding Zn-ribbon protein involved in translation (DUF1610 family)